MDRMPTEARILLGGMAAIWIAAKIHTLSTWNSGHYIERHWPFWVAMIAWPLLFSLGSVLSERWRTEPSALES